MGFWSTLATIGASLIPGVGAIAGPLVGAAVGKLENRGAAASPASSGAAGTSGTSGSDGLLDPTIQDAINRSRNSPAVQAEDYYKRALGGDRQSIQELLGPEISTVLSQYDTAAKTASELAPRGGGRTQALAELPFQKVAAYGQQLAGARSGAAEKLGALGEADANREAGLSESLLSNKVSRLNTTDRLAFEKKQASNANWLDLGKSVGGFLTSKNESGKPMYKDIGSAISKGFGKIF